LSSITIRLLAVLCAAALVSGCVKNEQNDEVELQTIQDVESSVAAFSQLFSVEHVPTISDYQRFFGFSDAQEFQWYWRECEKNHQIPYLQDQVCRQNAIKLWRNKETSTSRFLLWLQSIVPDNPAYKVTAIIPGKANKTFPGYRVVAEFDDKELEFWYPEKQKEVSNVGELQLTSIDGVPLSTLANAENEFSILAALGKKELLRPLTSEEKEKQQKLAEARCNADPRCVELRKNRKTTKEQREQRVQVFKRFDDSFKDWCKNNKVECREYISVKHRLNEQNKEIKQQCESSPEECESLVAHWFSRTKEVLSQFCLTNNQVCKSVDAADKTLVQRERQWCSKNTEHCNKLLSRYDRTLAQIKSEYYATNLN
jgi:hypothetical protein